MYAHGWLCDSGEYMISVDVACCVFSCVQWWALFFSPKRACLAQARLTEARPGFCVQTVAHATSFHFERSVISPRREWTRVSENPQGPLFKCSSSRLGEEELAWARGSLAWARPSSLSDTRAAFVLRCEWPTGMVACCINWEAWNTLIVVYAWCWYYGNFLIDWWNT